MNSRSIPSSGGLLPRRDDEKDEDWVSGMEKEALDDMGEPWPSSSGVERSTSGEGDRSLRRRDGWSSSSFSPDVRDGEMILCWGAGVSGGSGKG